MEIVEKVEEKDTLKIIVGSNEESLFSLLKTYLEKDPAVDMAGYYKEHHLIDKTEFFIKVKKGSPVDVLKKALIVVKKDLEKKKVK